MNAVSRFDAVRQQRGQSRLRTYAIVAGSVVAALLFVALVFQLFFRYQYLNADGVTWRVDRLTQETCQMGLGMPKCGLTPGTASSSVSTSTSTSTSPSLKKH